MIFWKCTATEQLLMFVLPSLLWMRTLIFLDLILLARNPNTNNMESITLDFPLPFGPMIDVKLWNANVHKYFAFLYIYIFLYYCFVESNEMLESYWKFY